MTNHKKLLPIIILLITALMYSASGFSREKYPLTILDNIFKISREREIAVKKDDFEIRAWIDAMFIPLDMPHSNKVFRRFNIEFNGKSLVHRLDAEDILKGEEYVVFDGNMRCTAKILNFESVSWSYPKAKRPVTEHFLKWVKVKITVKTERRYHKAIKGMICPYCGREFMKQGWKYCPFDGHRLRSRE